MTRPFGFSRGGFESADGAAGTETVVTEQPYDPFAVDAGKAGIELFSRD